MKRYERKFKEQMSDNEIIKKLGNYFNVRVSKKDFKNIKFVNLKKVIGFADIGGSLGHFVASLPKDTINGAYGWDCSEDELVDWLRKSGATEVKSRKALHR